MNNKINQLKNFTVLCVEDEEGIRKRLVNTLKYYFKEVYEAGTSQEAYDLYVEYKPTIILSDIEMPDEDGISLVKKIRKKDLDVVIVMITAYSSEKYLLELINLKINQFILKPINLDNLTEGLINALKHILIDKIQFAKDLYFDMNLMELIYQNEIVLLRKRDKEFLMLLHKNRNSVITYETIEEHLWRDRLMSMSALKTFIKEFRQRMPLDLIENIPQLGYKLITH